MLFRKEATNAVADHLHGKVIVLPKIPHLLFLSFILLWVVLVAIWLVSGTFARKATAQGWLEPKGGVVKIYADRPSSVANIMVKGGQLVIQGQPLMDIHDLDAFSDGNSIKDQLKAELDVQMARVKNQIESEMNILALRKERLLANQKKANIDILILENQIKNSTNKLKISHERFERVESLVDGDYISTEDYENAHLTKLEAENEHYSYALSLSKIQTEISDYELQVSELSQEHNMTVDRLMSDLSKLSESQTQLSNQYVTTITAPKAGIITNLQVTEGQQLRANELLLNIGDSETDLEIIILMPISAAGFVQKGQELLVRYDSFPHEKFGLYTASVVDVSSTLLLPEELHSSPIQVNTPVYKLKAQLDAQAISAYGNSFPLKQGMTLTADITLEDRSLIAWMLEPILSIRGRL